MTGLVRDGYSLATFPVWIYSRRHGEQHPPILSRIGGALQAIDSLGVFWLAGEEGDQLSGRVQFEPGRSGVKLSLVGIFDREDNSEGEANLRIFGWIGANQVTLEGCFRKGSKEPANGVRESRYYANRMFIGHHLEAEAHKFTHAEATFSNADLWVGRTGIRAKYSDQHPVADGGTIYSSMLIKIRQETSPYGRGTVGLRHSWETDGDQISDASIKQWPVLTFSYDEPQELETILADVRRVQNLITFCVDTPVILDKLTLQRNGINETSINGRDMGFPKSIEFVASVIPYTKPESRKPHHEHRMLLTFDQLGGLPAIARWLDVSPQFDRAIDSLLSVKYAEDMFSENRFLNATYGAEAYHRLTQNFTYMDQSEFASILEACLSATPEKHREWLEGKIGSSNDPSLVKRLSRLAGRAGPANRPLIGDKDRWAQTISRVRNELTHINSTSPNFSGSHLLYLTESVFAVVRTCMLLDCGVPIEAVTVKAESDMVFWYRTRLTEAINQVRDELRRLDAHRKSLRDAS
ncbi:hypothetical protein OWR29_07175 [Actinoplanes sp. Pm04-4]|uniref:ApeA N-terminal domain-containing protein n=1 Tax=Paractinoplanes pyxinae TaxID=2997416 RepID=A0ABT4AU52_9ACTN|nr:HEPN domain-containing protein [Actinoplanes pyxinae]MCY1137776.1 hypothetical protein [Actinoplanes pyxinae]